MQGGFQRARRQIGRECIVRETQRLGQLADTVEQPLGLLRQLAFLQFTEPWCSLSSLACSQSQHRVRGPYL